MLEAQLRKEAKGVGGADDGQNVDQPSRDGSDGRASTTPTRITVNIGIETERALRMVMDREQITLTEAVRRLIGYGDLLYATVKVDGKDVLIRHDGSTQQVLLV
jgi:hypothetical protein